MTYIERYLREHPAHTRGDFVSAHCPDLNEKECPLLNRPDLDCYDCWDREAPPRKVKPRRKEHEKANG